MYLPSPTPPCPLTRQVSSLSSLDRKYVSSIPSLASASTAAAALPSGIHRAPLLPGTGAAPTGIHGPGAGPPAGIYDVPPPRAAEPDEADEADETRFRYPDYLPSLFPESLRPVRVAMPCFEETVSMTAGTYRRITFHVCKSRRCEHLCARAIQVSAATAFSKLHNCLHEERVKGALQLLSNSHM